MRRMSNFKIIERVKYWCLLVFLNTMLWKWWWKRNINCCKENDKSYSGTLEGRSVHKVARYNKLCITYHPYFVKRDQLNVAQSGTWLLFTKYGQCVPTFRGTCCLHHHHRLHVSSILWKGTTQCSSKCQLLFTKQRWGNLIYVLYVENSAIWQPFGPEGAGYSRFYCPTVLVQYPTLMWLHGIGSEVCSCGPVCTVDHTMAVHCLYLKHIYCICLCYYSQFDQLEVTGKM